MNAIEEVLVRKTNALLLELEELTAEIIEEGYRKFKSTSMKDLMTAKELDPKYTKRVTAIHMQLGILFNILESRNGKRPTKLK